jgi:hypothetical protein
MRVAGSSTPRQLRGNAVAIPRDTGATDRIACNDDTARTRDRAVRCRAVALSLLNWI